MITPSAQTVRDRKANYCFARIRKNCDLTPSLLFLVSIAISDVCGLLRTLGYRPDVARVSSLFASLSRRLASSSLGGDPFSSSIPGSNFLSSHLHSAVAALDQDEAFRLHNEEELTLTAFVQLMRQEEHKESKEREDEAYSGGRHATARGTDAAAPPLGAELEELQTSLARMALADQESSASRAAPHLLNVKTLKQRLRVAAGGSARLGGASPTPRGARSVVAAAAASSSSLHFHLSDSEFSSLLEFAGVMDAAAMPAPYLRHAGLGFIDHKALVHKMAQNKATKGV